MFENPQLKLYLATLEVSGTVKIVDDAGNITSSVLPSRYQGKVQKFLGNLMREQRKKERFT